MGAETPNPTDTTRLNVPGPRSEPDATFEIITRDSVIAYGTPIERLEVVVNGEHERPRIIYSTEGDRDSDIPQRVAAINHAAELFTDSDTTERFVRQYGMRPSQCAGRMATNLVAAVKGNAVSSVFTQFGEAEALIDMARHIARARLFGEMKKPPLQL